MRFAMKPGVSLATTTPLPKMREEKSFRKSTTSGRVSLPGISSSSFISQGGLKKWAPRNRPRNSNGRFAAISSMESPEVFVVTMASRLHVFAIFWSSDRLMSSLSTTASIIQSASPVREKSSSKFPALTSSAWNAEWKTGVLAPLRRSLACNAMMLRASRPAGPLFSSPGTISSKST